MKITKEDLGPMLEMAKEIDELEPLVVEFRSTIQKIVKLLLMYGPEIHEVASAICLGGSKIRIAQIALYENSGFTREEAIDLVTDEWTTIKRTIKTSNKKSS